MSRITSWWWRRSRIDVLVDIDGTLAHADASGSIKADTRYNLAHGALEFLVALDRIPGVRIGFYSCGMELRNKYLIKPIVDLIEKSMGHRMKKSLKAFTVADGYYGKKTLKGLRKGLNLDRTILVDDLGMHIEQGEQKNLLKVYPVNRQLVEDQMTDAQQVYKARVANNLVRALGLILKAIEISKSGDFTVVDALYKLQWNGDSYLHEESNSEFIYHLGLEAMNSLRPGLGLADQTSAHVLPWSQHGEDDELFPKHRHLIIREPVFVHSDAAMLL